jgi:Ser/Thr protein kinase RdoA (MazF antagonist)
MLQEVVNNAKNKFNLYLEKRNMLKLIKIDILNKHGINFVKFKPLTNGFMHLSYACYTTDNNAFALRILQDRSADSAQQEGDLLDQLSHDPILKDHVVKMISDKDGQKIGNVKDISYCLFHYIHNKPLVRMSDDHLCSIAMIIRIMHEIGRDLYQNYQSRKLLDTQYIIDNLLDFYSKKIITYDEYINMTEIVTNYNLAIKKYIKKTIIHCDIHRGNLLLNKENNRLILIDFDDFSVGPPIVDLAIMVQMICFERTIFDTHKAKKLINTYFDASKNLIEYDVKDLVIFMLFNLVSASEHYLQSPSLGKNEEYLMAYKRIEVIQKTKDFIQKELEFVQSISG